MRWMLLLAVLVLTACTHKPAPTSPPAPIPPPRAVPVPLPSPLAAEQRWMRQWFGGTPVELADLADGSLQVQVPLVHAFEPQAHEPKPALRAVLDRLGESLARQPASRLHLGAPGAPPALARERLAALRTHLATRGVAAARLPAAAPLAADKVLLRLAPGPQAVRQLDDAALPPQPTWAPPRGAPAAR